MLISIPFVRPEIASNRWWKFDGRTSTQKMHSNTCCIIRI